MAFLQTLLQPFFWIVIVLIWLLYRRMQKTGEALVRGTRLYPASRAHVPGLRDRRGLLAVF